VEFQRKLDRKTDSGNCELQALNENFETEKRFIVCERGFAEGRQMLSGRKHRTGLPPLMHSSF
jgi:hypothetical protein